MATWTTPGHIISGQTAGVATALQTYETDLLVFNQAWTTYTPTLAGWVLTTGGSITGRYVQAGKTVIFTARVTLGTVFTISALLSVGLPVSSNTTLGRSATAELNQAGTAWLGAARLTSTTADVRSLGTNGVMNTMTSTVPFTWANTHYVEVSGVYEAA